MGVVTAALVYTFCVLWCRAEHGQQQQQQPAASYHTMSLKFNDHHLESPLDLVLTTGRHGPYFNATTMDQFQAALKSGSEDMKKYLLSMPVWYVIIAQRNP